MVSKTIAAISTAPGIGGIGIIRMSGEDCFEILEKIFDPIKKEPIESIKGYTMKFGFIHDKEGNRIESPCPTSIIFIYVVLVIDG